MKKIIRTPIWINNHTLAVINIFDQKEGHLEDIWMTDSDDYEQQVWENAEAGAKQLIEHLGGEQHLTPAFLINLKKEISGILSRHDSKYGTKFNKE